MRSSSARPTALVPSAVPATTSAQRSVSSSSHRPPLTVSTGPGAQQTQNELHFHHILPPAVNGSTAIRLSDSQAGQRSGGEVLSPLALENHAALSKTAHISNLTSPPNNAPPPAVAYNHIQRLAIKRISTLEYLRQAYVFSSLRRFCDSCASSHSSQS